MRLALLAGPRPLRPARRLARSALLVGFTALLLAGCVTDRDVTGSIGQAGAPPSNAVDMPAYTADWGRKYDADPGSKTAALNYAAGLRAQDRIPQAVAVLQTAAIKYPNDREVLSAYGKTLADAGRLKEAADILPRAHTPDKPDWTVLSAEGSVADQLGDHQSAQGYYEAALKIAPDSPTTLSNLGLSYALDKRLPLAEDTLRHAVAQPGATMRVRQNLALVLALEGKFDEAERVARTDLSPDDAAASITSIRSMIAQSPTWRGVQKTRKPAVAAPNQG